MRRYYLVESMTPEEMAAVDPMVGYRAVFGGRPYLGQVITAIQKGCHTNVAPEDLLEPELRTLHALGAKKVGEDHARKEAAGKIWLPSLNDQLKSEESLKVVGNFMAWEEYEQAFAGASAGYEHQKNLLLNLLQGGQFAFSFSAHHIPEIGQLGFNDTRTYRCVADPKFSEDMRGNLILTVNGGYTSPSGGDFKGPWQMVYGGPINVVSELELRDNLKALKEGRENDAQNDAVIPLGGDQMIPVLAGLPATQPRDELWANFVKDQLQEQLGVSLKDQPLSMISSFGSNDPALTFYFQTNTDGKVAVVRGINDRHFTTLSVEDDQKRRDEEDEVSSGFRTAEYDFVLRGQEAPILTNVLSDRLTWRDLKPRSE